jgi:cysteine desulfurase
VGTIQNLEEIGKICAEHEAIFHVDAVQSFTKVPIDVKSMKVDLLSISAHLIHGPKGVGALYVRDGVKLTTVLDGDYREQGLRPGTENVPGIVGFGKAVEIAREEHVAHMRRLRDRLIDGLLQVPESRLNGPKGDKRLCNNTNVTFRYVEGESLLLHLDMRGVMVTTGSACFSRTLEPSHVILAMGLKHEDAHGSLRLTVSKYNTEDEIDYAIEKVGEVVEVLRKISPLR